MDKNPLSSLPPPPQGQTGVSIDTFSHLPPPPKGQQGLTLDQIPTASEPKSQGGFMNTLGNFAEGAVKGGLKTAVGTASLLQKGGQRILAAIDPTQTYEQVKKTTGLKSLDTSTQEGQGVQQVLNPEGTAQKVGYTAERIAEFLLPSSKVAGAQKLATGAIRATEGAGLLARATAAVGRTAAKAGIEAASSGAITAAQQGEVNNDVKTAAIVGGLFSGVGSILGGAKNLVGQGVKATGQKIQMSVIKPSIRDVEDGFKIQNLKKYDLGGSLQDTLTKSNVKMNELKRQLQSRLKGSNIAVNLNDIYERTITKLGGAKAANFGDIGATKRIAETLKNEIGDIAGKNGLVDLLEAQSVKQAAGTKGAWVYGSPDPDSRAIEKVYTTFYNELKTAIEESAPEGVKGINRQLSELIPISNAVIRRIPVDARNNAISLTDSLSLFGAVFDPKALGFYGVNKLSKSGKFANLLVKAGDLLKNSETDSAVGQRIFGNNSIKSVKLPAYTEGSAGGTVNINRVRGLLPEPSYIPLKASKDVSGINPARVKELEDYYKEQAINNTLKLPAPRSRPTGLPTIQLPKETPSTIDRREIERLAKLRKRK